MYVLLNTFLFKTLSMHVLCTVAVPVDNFQAKKSPANRAKDTQGSVLDSQGVTIHDRHHRSKVFLIRSDRTIPLMRAADVHHVQALP